MKPRALLIVVEVESAQSRAAIKEFVTAALGGVQVINEPGDLKVRQVNVQVAQAVRADR